MTTHVSASVEPHDPPNTWARQANARKSREAATVESKGCKDPPTRDLSADSTGLGPTANPPAAGAANPTQRERKGKKPATEGAAQHTLHAPHLPLVDAELNAEALDIGDEVPRRVVVERRVRGRLAAAALVKTDDAVPGGVCVGWVGGVVVVCVCSTRGGQ